MQNPKPINRAIVCNTPPQSILSSLLFCLCIIVMKTVIVLLMERENTALWAENNMYSACFALGVIEQHFSSISGLANISIGVTKILLDEMHLQWTNNKISGIKTLLDR